MECLSHVLNTNQKRQLLIPIRDSYIKPSDLSKFNQLALEYGLATPLKKKKSDSKDGVKKIEIKRNADGEWGFNIRGGSEHGIGIFVSSVEPGSNAAKSGLKAGDQIKKANDLNCETVTHHEAVSVSSSLCIVHSNTVIAVFIIYTSIIPGSLSVIFMTLTSSLSLCRWE